MNDVKLVTADMAAMQVAIQKKRSEIKKEKNIDILEDWLKKIKTMKEIAKLNDVADQLRQELIFMEMDILLRFKALNQHHRIPAYYKGSFRIIEEDVKAFKEAVRAYTKCFSVIAVSNAIKKKQYEEMMSQHAKDILKGEEEYPASKPFTITKLPSRIDEVLIDYSHKGEPFSIGDMVSKLQETSYIMDRGHEDPELKNLLREACLDAVRKSRKVQISGMTLPRFVTFYTESGWMRVPVENATIDQLIEMRSLRERQLTEDKEALKRLTEVISVVGDSIHSQGKPRNTQIGELIFDQYSDEEIA